MIDQEISRSKVGIDTNVFLRIVLGMMLLYFAVAGGHLYTADDWSRYYAARNFTISLTPEVPDKPHVYGVPGRDGRRVSHFPPGLSIMSMPLLLSGRLIPSSNEIRSEMYERVFLSFTNQIIVAVLIGLMYLTIRRTGIHRRYAIFLSVGMGVGSLAFPYAKHYWAEPLQAALLLGALLSVDRITMHGTTEWRVALMSSCLSMAFLVKYESVVPILIIVGYTIFTHPPTSRYQITGFIIPFLLAGAVSISYNAWRFGSPLDFGYSGLVLPTGDQSADEIIDSDLSSFSFIRRLVLLLFSPGQGLIVFVPVVALAIFATTIKGFPVFIRLGFCCGFALLAFYVALDRSSTWCWGPRYLFPSMVLWWPALGLIRSKYGKRLVTLGLGFGLVIALLGVLVNFHDGIEEIREHRNFTGWEWVREVQRNPELSPIVWHARLLPSYVERSIRPEPGEGAIQYAPVKWRHKRLDILWVSLVVGGYHWILLLIPVFALGAACMTLRSAVHISEV